MAGRRPILHQIWQHSARKREFEAHRTGGAGDSELEVRADLDCVLQWLLTKTICALAHSTCFQSYVDVADVGQKRAQIPSSCQALDFHASEVSPLLTGHWKTQRTNNQVAVTVLGPGLFLMYLHLAAW